MLSPVAGLTGTKRQNCLNLNVQVFEGLQLLKNVYCNGHISAASNAEQYLDALIAALHDDTMDNEDSARDTD
jgi:hypothetical protein